jgi:hypothetical protein
MIGTARQARSREALKEDFNETISALKSRMGIGTHYGGRLAYGSPEGGGIFP